jgi:hypothetical protein
MADPSYLLPASFRLACACAMWPPSAARDAAVRAAAVGVDWESFLRVSVRQRIRTLAWAALECAGVAPPEPVATALARNAAAQSARSLALAAEALRLRALFEADGIEVLFVKGATLAQLAYGVQTLKHCRDIDLLVDPGAAERAFQRLRGEGYVGAGAEGDLGSAQRRTLYRLRKDMELTHPERRLNVELHWRLVDNPVLLKAVGLASPSQEVAVLDGRLRTLADSQLFAYLCVHGATHSWFRLKWLADLNAWLARKTDAEIAQFHHDARRLGVEACAAQALSLRERLLGSPAPALLAPELRGRKRRVLVAAALDAMAGGGGETELSARPWGPLRLLRPQFLRGRGPAFVFAQWRMLAESLDDALTLPLPRALRFLYPPLRLPLWLLRVYRRRRRLATPDAG